MLAFIINNDGSVYAAILPKYVIQGSYGEIESNKLAVAFKDRDITDNVVIAHFKMPNGDTSSITLQAGDELYFQQDRYISKSEFLTQRETYYAGILYVSFEIMNQAGTEVLYTYNAKITVNPSTFEPDEEDTHINNAQYENLAIQITNLQNKGASKAYVDEKVASAAISPIQSVLDVVYPVGSIYLSTNHVSPHDFIGGTWVRIEGKFLLGATGDTPTFDDDIQETANVGPGGQGGEATHELELSEIPEHNHRSNQYLYSLNLGSGEGANSGVVYSAGLGSVFGTIEEPVGGGQDHNNMPPFLAVYMWRRTA